MTPPYQKPTGRPTVTSSMSDAEITEVRAIIRKFQEAGLISTRPGIADDYIDAVQRKVKEKLP
jgi:hypothetical protein